jgi:hypothetical protein
MNLVESDGKNFVFELRQRERELLMAILKMYPLLNPDYHHVSKRKGDAKITESQALLHEAMAGEQATNKKAVAEFFEDANWKPANKGASQVTLSAEKVEWLLQVLNDVRVGSWVKLGKPDPQKGDKVDSKIENIPYIGAMELSGVFQSILLEALES